MEMDLKVDCDLDWEPRTRIDDLKEALNPMPVRKQAPTSMRLSGISWR
jgi:hypothetical protein